MPEEVDEDPIFNLDSSVLESGCQDCPETKNLDSDEFSAMSMSSESADDEDFFDCSDQEWETIYQHKQLNSHQSHYCCTIWSSIESKTSTPSLNPRQLLSYVDFKANNRGPLSVPTDTDAKLLGDQVATNSESFLK